MMGSSIINPIIKRFINRQGQVSYFTAFFADKMIMRADVRIKSVKSAPKINFIYFSLFNEYVQVAVNCAHTQVGKIFFQFFKEPVSRRMIRAALQEFENAFPLSAPFVKLNYCFSLLFPNRKRSKIVIPGRYYENL